MVASDFDGLRGYRTLEYEGQVPTKPYNHCFSRGFRLYCYIWHVRAIPTYRVCRLCDYAVQIAIIQHYTPAGSVVAVKVEGVSPAVLTAVTVME